jgi:pimeloyl-ACP methyl ester carboxylesterase
MIVEDFPGSFGERMERLEGLLRGITGLILVGSSYGGLMAAVYACLHGERVEKLILLAPAIHLDDFDPFLGGTSGVPTVLIHGTGDDVVPLEPVRTRAEKVFTRLEYRLVEDDHSLHRVFPLLDWDALLESRENP